METKIELATVIIRAVTLVVVGVIIPAIRRWLNTKTENAKMERVKAWARTAVAAAEQMYRKYDDPHGTKRKKYAAEAILSMGIKCGIHLTKEEAETLIEAAVQEINLLNPIESV